MGTSTSLAQAGAKLDKVLSPATLRAMTRAGGMAAKKAALEAAARDLGGDRKMSGFKRGGALTAGFDQAGPTSVLIKFRPPGKWILADQGRKNEKRVVAGKGRRTGSGRVRAFRTPDGPRRAFDSKPSRGLGTLKDAKREAAKDVPKAAHKELRQQLGQVF